MSEKQNLFLLSALVFLVLGACSYSSNSNTGTQIISEEIEFEPSLKEEKKGFVEHLDSTTLVYSNFKYNIAVDFPNHWIVDKGLSEHTIIRGGFADSGLSLAINVIELKDIEIGDKTAWHLYENKQAWEEEKQVLLQNATKEELFNFNSRKVHLSNVEAIEYRFSRIFRQIDLEFEMQHIVYEFFYHNRSYSVGLQVPLFLYDENPERYNSLFYGVTILKNNKNH